VKRILGIVCGAGVLYTALGHVHILQHLVTMHHHDLMRPAFLLSVFLALAVELLAFGGGVILLLGGK
jgi:hypothetical protein